MEWQWILRTWAQKRSRGWAVTVLLGGLLWLRKFLSKDATDRAMDNADTRCRRSRQSLMRLIRYAASKVILLMQSPRRRAHTRHRC